MNLLPRLQLLEITRYLADFDDFEADSTRELTSAVFRSCSSGGKLLNNQTIVNTALQLVDACWNTYASTATGIGPESPTQLAFNRKNDFCITSSVYILRPEVLESNFYAFRVTGDTKYLNRAAGGITDSSTITWRLQMGLQGSMM
ncbi:hypothetical protein L208DRAFT_126379 [Tricholoma matsutake]|nr:hypothetical protein L208DRAFT_126379 [Tricholoma matsutake 945]